MKLKTSFILAIIHFAFSIFNSQAAEYTLKGERWLRMYTADRATPVYNARLDAARIVNGFCNVPWTKTSVASAHETSHSSTNLDANVANREAFDAALFCARHADSMHVAYANAACYRIDLGNGTLPNLTSLAVNVYSDPYNASGSRIVLMTNDSGKIPTDCATVRGDVTGGIKATNVARRIAVTSGGKDYWYPNSTNLVFSTQQLGASGIQLHRYLYVFVLLENYGTTRGDWLEGSAFIDNEIRITTSAVIPSMSDGCDIAEPYATTYHLKDGRAGDDDDGDGLSNYAEYLITEVFKFANLSPDNPKSDGTTPDFFRKVGNFYLGEIFTSRKTEAESDVKNVLARIVYNGPQDVDTLTIEAWKDYGVSKPDAIWRIGKKDAISSDFNSMTFKLANPDKGQLRMGSNTFVVYAGNSYVAGAPYGFIGDVNVGRKSAEFDLEVTDTSPVFARINLNDGRNDRSVHFGSDSGNVVMTNANDSTALSGGKCNHVRIVPWLFSCTHIDESNYDREWLKCSDYIQTRVVAEFDIDTDLFPCITEANFIKNDKFDIDWDGFYTTSFALNQNVVNLRGGNSRSEVSAVKYAIVLGTEGPAGPISSGDTQSVYKVHSTLIERRFEKKSDRTLPTSLTIAEGGVLYGSRPTFKWRLDEPAEIKNLTKGSATFGCSYTAFQIQVIDADTLSVVYDSGVRRAPARNAAGEFVWKTPLVAGQWTGRGFFSKAGNWMWRVAMYNAKFVPRATENGWSDYSCFSTAVGQQQESDDHGYGSIKLAVKYAGPVEVISDVYFNTNTASKVRVQAFSTSDFSGCPEAESVCDSMMSLTNSSDVSSNVQLDGLKIGNTYWILAFIDTDGDGYASYWESCGHAKEPVAVSANKASESVEIFIDDADNDGDFIPDAYEYISDDFLVLESDVVIDHSGSIVLPTATYCSITNGTANFSKYLPGASLTFFQNLWCANLIFGDGENMTTNTLSNIRAIIDNNIREE